MGADIFVMCFVGYAKDSAGLICLLWRVAQRTGWNEGNSNTLHSYFVRISDIMAYNLLIIIYSLHLCNITKNTKQ